MRERRCAHNRRAGAALPSPHGEPSLPRTCCAPLQPSSTGGMWRQRSSMWPSGVQSNAHRSRAHRACAGFVQRNMQLLAAYLMTLLIFTYTLYDSLQQR